jgi:hypothetical protein
VEVIRMSARRVILEGPAARGVVIAADVLAELLGVMLDGSRKAVRLVVEGRSTANGTPPPAWLDRAVVFDVTGLGQGSTVVSTSARPLHETLPEHLAGLPWLDGATAGITGLDVWCAGLADALGDQRDSDRFDAPLLESYLGLGRILAKGFVALELEGPERLRIGHEQVEVIARLLASVPRPRQVRITGTLEPLEPGDRRFTLTLPHASVRGLLDEGMPSERLAEWSGRVVLASGLAIFRPSGSLLRLEAQRLDVPRKGAEVWNEVPKPLFAFAEPASTYRVPQTPHNGLAALIGQWPGDEGDDAVDEALEYIS